MPMSSAKIRIVLGVESAEQIFQATMKAVAAAVMSFFRLVVDLSAKEGIERKCRCKISDALRRSSTVLPGAIANRTNCESVDCRI